MTDAVGAIPEGHRASVLLVDDHAENLTALTAILEPLGLDLILARSGEQALKELLQTDVALILLDVRMPGMDGFETAAAIKQRTRSSNIPIIFITAIDGDPYHALRGYSEGAVDYITKPIDAWVLRSKVAVFVELDGKNRALRRQAYELECANAELARLTEAATSAATAKSAFLSLVGHELRTPLTVISGYLSMLNDGSFGDLEAGIVGPLATIESKADELRRLVDSLLEAARAETNVDAPEPVAQDLREVVAAAMSRASPRAALLAATLSADVSTHAITVNIDGRQIGHVLDNLINNALTYTAPPIEIGVTTRIAEGRAEVLVSDNGPGIEAGMRGAVFERFVRATTVENEPRGTGLGLYIARLWAQRNGGGLTLVSSELGGGTTFRLDLPLAETADGADAARTQVESDEAVIIPKAVERIPAGGP